MTGYRIKDGLNLGRSLHHRSAFMASGSLVSCSRRGSNFWQHLVLLWRSLPMENKSQFLVISNCTIVFGNTMASISSESIHLQAGGNGTRIKVDLNGEIIAKRE